MAVFIFYQRGSWIPFGSGDDSLPHLMEIGGRDRFRERQLLRKYGGYANFVRLNINVWGDDGARRVINTFALPKT